MVINGPLATAGSTLIFLKIIGTMAPTKELIVIDINKASPTIPDALRLQLMKMFHLLLLD